MKTNMSENKKQDDKTQWETILEVLQDAGESLSLTEIIDHTLGRFPGPWERTVKKYNEGDLKGCRHSFRSTLNHPNYKNKLWINLGNNEFEAIDKHQSDDESSESTELETAALRCGLNMLRKEFDWQKMEVTQHRHSADKESGDETIKLREVQGIYLLRKGEEVVYVGEGVIGNRLYSHHQERLFRNRWDAFDWFEWEDKATRKQLEAFLINSSLPRLNKKKELKKLEVFDGVLLKAKGSYIYLDDE